MIVPYLSIACACGRSASVKCPTIADILTAQETFIGWRYDDHGLARCPKCLAAGMVAAPLARQHELFGDAA